MSCHVILVKKRPILRNLNDYWHFQAETANVWNLQLPRKHGKTYAKN